MPKGQFLSESTSKTERKHGKIFNVGLSSTSTDRVLSFVRDSIARGYKFFITTPNPEILLKAQGSKTYENILNNSDITVPDGVGLIIASKFLGGFDSPLKLIKGRELFMDLVRLANQKEWKVFFFGGEKGEAELCKEKLRRNFKAIRIESMQGPQYNLVGEPINESGREEEERLIRKINEFAPQILFVALGAPKQEYWVANNMEKLKVGGVMVVGGTFNYISGKMRLPPVWMSRFGFEWLYRVIHEPKRIGRIFNAVVVFPMKVIASKFGLHM